MKLGRFLVWLLRPLVWLLFPYKVIGRENIPTEEDKRGVVLCCNHISMVDPAFLMVGQRRHIYFMAKAEIFKTAIGRWFFGKELGAFSVDRGKADMGSIEHAEGLVNEGKIIGIFPEGTRSKTGELGRVKSGAAMILTATKGELLPACLITKNQRVRLFRPVKLVFGKPIPFEELCPDAGGKADLRRASRHIQAELQTLLEEHGNES